MQFVFSNDNKFRTWRRLWLALARAEQIAGLDISDEQIAELAAHLDDINYEEARAREKIVRHDVMSHVYAYGLQCPAAKGIIHLGATSCYVGDNTDIIIMRRGLEIVRRKLLNVIALLAGFALKHKDLPALAYTHLQPAQLTTVGKRAALWINEFLMDFEETEHRLSRLQLLGSKGTTGTQASFMELFGGDGEKIDQLERDIAHEMGFDETVPVSGQTYSRKIDYQILSVLGGVAQSASKFSNDLRILQGNKEMEEPFERGQIGSSAMPYKRNPMRSERITSLSRYIIIDTLNPAITAAAQWFERTLDDSANRRVSVAEAFLASDGVLNLLLNVCDGLVVYPKIIEQRVMQELPFMATENIMMAAVRNGGDRQTLHEKLRIHAMAAAKAVKEEGGGNDLIQRVLTDPDFNIDEKQLKAALKPENFVGRAPEQTEKFIREKIQPLLEKNKNLLGEKAEILL
jgi:adenylosuccinate lyase